MHLQRLELFNFRSYDHRVFEPIPTINIVRGQNATGKTNLIEAVHFMTGAGSFRTSKDADLIKHGCDGFRLIADAHSDGRDQHLEFRRDVNGKSYIINGVRKRRRADVMGLVRCVTFCPDDLDLIKGSSAERRNFLDSSISQIRPNYASCVSEYNKILAQKSRILRDYHKKPSLLESLDDFTSQLLTFGARIILYRRSFCETLSVNASEEHEKISGGREVLTVNYSCPYSGQDVKSLYLEMWDAYTKRRKDELEREMILIGPHRDDLEVLIDGVPARDFASQGQIRTAVLSLMLAKRSLYFKNTGEYPIMLLDDVLSELDEKRRSYVLNKTGEGQVFITTCDNEDALIRELSADVRVFVPPELV